MGQVLCARNPALGRLRQDYSEFKDSLDYASLERKRNRILSTSAFLHDDDTAAAATTTNLSVAQISPPREISVREPRYQTHGSPLKASNR